MTKTVTKENMVAIFPINDNHLKALAAIVASELEALYKENDYVRLYAVIDKLGEELLDILAFDFKVDWWNSEDSLSEKRELFKNLWLVHRKLGTPKAVDAVLQGFYPSVKIIEWYNYGGHPYRFKLLMEMGSKLPDIGRLNVMLPRIEYFKNKRSILEGCDFDIRKAADLFIGVALQKEMEYQYEISGINADDYVIMTDEDGNYLTDEDGNILTGGN